MTQTICMYPDRAGHLLRRRREGQIDRLHCAAMISILPMDYMEVGNLCPFESLKRARCHLPVHPHSSSKPVSVCVTTAG